MWHMPRHLTLKFGVPCIAPSFYAIQRWITTGYTYEEYLVSNREIKLIQQETCAIHGKRTNHTLDI